MNINDIHELRSHLCLPMRPAIGGFLPRLFWSRSDRGDRGHATALPVKHRLCGQIQSYSSYSDCWILRHIKLRILMWFVPCMVMEVLIELRYIEEMIDSSIASLLLCRSQRFTASASLCNLSMIEYEYDTKASAIFCFYWRSKIEDEIYQIDDMCTVMNYAGTEYQNCRWSKPQINVAKHGRDWYLQSKWK